MKKALFALALSSGLFTGSSSKCCDRAFTGGNEHEFLGLQTETFDFEASPSVLPNNNGAGSGTFGSTLLIGATFAGTEMRGLRMGSLAGSARPPFSWATAGIGEYQQLSEISIGGSEMISFLHTQNTFGFVLGVGRYFQHVDFQLTAS